MVVSAAGGGGDRVQSMNIALYAAAAGHHGSRELLFRLAKQGLSQISGGRILRIIGHFVLSLSRRCFGASVRDRFCRDTSDQRWALHRPFHPLFALFLLWLRQETKGSSEAPGSMTAKI